MAAPAAVARQDPAGLKLWDGHSTLVATDLDPDISFWEKTVTPPGVDGGEAIPQTTMHNNVWRTFRPRQLKTLTQQNLVAAYDPAIIDQAVAIINVEGTYTTHFPDLSTWAYFAFLQMFQPTENSEGNQPEANALITPTNRDPSVSTETEEGAVLVSVSGT